jgi:hypothetical protein
LAPIFLENEEAIMNKVTNKARTKTPRQVRSHAKHLQATYWFTCNQTENAIILRFERMDGNHPTTVEIQVPVKVGNEAAFIHILNNGTLKLIGCTDRIVTS